MNEIGVLGTVSYLGACSGSCWGLSVLMRHLELLPDAPMTKVLGIAKDDLRERLSKPLINSMGDSAKQVLRQAAKKIALLQSLSLVTVYGNILATAWPTSSKLSHQKDVLMKGHCPLPIYAAGSIDLEEKEVVTAEFTPL